VYLGGTVSEDAAIEQDIKRRIGLACGVMQNLNPIWKAKEIKKDTKKRVYESLVLSVLLYNSVFLLGPLMKPQIGNSKYSLYNIHSPTHFFSDIYISNPVPSANSFDAPFAAHFVCPQTRQ